MTHCEYGDQPNNDLEHRSASADKDCRRRVPATSAGRQLSMNSSTRYNCIKATLGRTQMGQATKKIRTALGTWT